MIKKIYDIFKKREAKLLGNYRKTAVTILIDDRGEKENIIFEVRAYTLKHQPGDVALPGGKVESEEMPKEAAIRETMEELNLKKEDFEVIGNMDYFITPYGTIIYPFIGRLKGEIEEPNRAEVEKVFKVPVEFFLNTEPLLYSMEIGPTNREGFPYHLIEGGDKYKFSKGKIDEYFYKYEEYVIWGFTAMIIKGFVDIIKKNRYE